MSKIICDICGTSYPETASQCPICGCVRPGEVQRVSDESKSEGNMSVGYTYVKGGRFSKSNVKKRNNGKAFVKSSEGNSSKKPDSSGDKSNRGLVITAIVLLLAIVAVVVYIAIRYFLPVSSTKNPEPADTNPPVQTQQNESQTDEKDLSCTSLTLESSSIVFEQKGDAKLLTVSVEPGDTTDVITFKSSDESVATVSIDGKITAVGSGTAIITVTCGDVSAECAVLCDLEEETEPPTETTTDTTEDTTSDTKPSEDEFRLNRKDITFSAKNDSWVLYSGSIAKNLVTFGSENDSVATFVEGKVVAVGPGTTEVFAEYEGQKISCVIRCNFQESSGVGGNGGGVSEDGGGVSEDSGNSSGNTTEGSCAIFTQYGNSGDDFSIGVGDKLQLTLKDSAGNVIDVTWSTNSSAFSISGNTVTAVSKTIGSVVSATYNGLTYSCTIRVN